MDGLVLMEGTEQRNYPPLVTGQVKHIHLYMCKLIN